jgi:hypothetical protein
MNEQSRCKSCGQPLLTRLNEALDGGPEALKAIRVELSDGRELSLVFPVGEVSSDGDL